MRSAVHQPLPVPSLDLTPARHAARSVVMVTSPGSEPTRAAVAVNLATVCAEIGQRVVIVTTDGLDAHVDGLEPPRSTAPLTDDERDRRLTGPLRPDGRAGSAGGHQRSRRVVPGLAALRGPHELRW